MSRSFNGTSDYLEHGAAVVGAVPITMACLFYLYELPSVAVTLMSVGDSAADTKAFIFIGPTNKNIIAQITAVDATSASAASNTNTRVRLGIWQHACGVFTSATARAVFLDGAAKGSNVSSEVLGTPTVTSIGTRYVAGVRGSFMDGLIAEAAIWNVALDDAEVQLLSRGYYPDQIRPGNLVSYWPLTGQYSPDEIDHKGRFDATVFGARPVISEHPPMIPRRRRHRALDFASMLSLEYTFQYARPDSDITEGGWLPSSGGSLYAVVDELVADDADRMRSNTGSAADAVTLGLSDITTPDAGTVDITIRHRIGT